MKLLKRSAPPVDPPTPSYVTCDGGGDTDCLERLAAGRVFLHDMCPACLAWTMASLDVAARRDLPWCATYRERAGAHSPAALDAEQIRRACL